jgi:NAD(P)-dependent dehydrogenase (short-subunit alcohol dehydrogenase family)
MQRSFGQGKKILITGGTSGLGFQLVNHFLRYGYVVYATGRNQQNVLISNVNFHFIKVDFSDLREVSSVIKKLMETSPRFDIVINNAGVLSPPEYTPTRDGIEYSFQINFLSHLLINELIINKKYNSDPLIIVSVTSPVYKYVKPDFKLPDQTSYRSFKIYAESKLYLLLIGYYLYNKYPGKNLKYIGYDPGTFSSDIYRMQKSWFRKMYRIASPFMRSPSKVARILFEIFQEQEMINGVVYKGKNKFRNMNYVDNEAKKDFMTRCYTMIESYIR